MRRIFERRWSRPFGWISLGPRQRCCDPELEPGLAVASDTGNRCTQVLWLYSTHSTTKQYLDWWLNFLVSYMLFWFLFFNIWCHSVDPCLSLAPFWIPGSSTNNENVSHKCRTLQGLPPPDFFPRQCTALWVSKMISDICWVLKD